MGRRIVTKPAITTIAGARVAVVPDGYLTRLVKYVPVEIIALFTTADAVFKANPGMVSTNAYWVVFAAFLVGTPLYIGRITAVQGKPLAVTQIAVSTILFVVWVLAIGGPFARLSWYNSMYAALPLPVVLGLAGLIVPRPDPV